MSSRSISSEALSPEQTLDLEKHRGEQATKRKESMWGAFKAIGVALAGTAVVGITVALVNLQIQETELDLEEKKFKAADQDAKRNQEHEYLQQYLNQALHDNLQRRIDFAHYVSSITLNEEMRELWTKYHKELEQELTDSRKDLKQKIRDLNEKLAASEQDSTTITRLRQEIDTLSRRLAPDISSRAPMLILRPKRTGNELLLEIERRRWSGAFHTASTYYCKFDLPAIGESKNAKQCWPITGPDSLMLRRVGEDEFDLEVAGRSVLGTNIVEGHDRTYIWREGTMINLF